jgi:hypothetical protein
MKNLSNVEKSVFFPKTYVVYDGDGRVWHACKIHDGTWSGRPVANHPNRALMKHRTANTLTELATKIGAIKKSPAIENV